MDTTTLRTYTAFEGTRRVASGALDRVAAETKAIVDRGPRAPVLVFDDETSEQVEIDWRGAREDVVERYQVRPRDATEEAPIRGPGRPRLGVVAREVTLLPRHWDWLNRQPGGASVALRKLVEEARRLNREKDRVRESRDASYRFMSALAGNLPGFEEAARALFAGDAAKFRRETRRWPKDLRAHLARLTRDCLIERDQAPE